MIACPLVAECAIDEDEVWRGPDRSNLPGGRHADEQPATGCEKLFGDQHGERSTDRAAYDSDLANAVEIEGEKFGVIAGPSFMDAARAGPLEVTDNVAIWIEHADFWDGDLRQLPLPSRLPQQGFGSKHGGLFVVLAANDRPSAVRAINLLVHDGTSFCLA